MNFKRRCPNHPCRQVTKEGALIHLQLQQLPLQKHQLLPLQMYRRPPPSSPV